MYGFESRVRFSEIDHTESMTIPALVNYFQDCSTFQSEDIGLGIEALKERGKVWILSSWQIIVNRYPRMGEGILTETWPTGFNKILGLRNFRMKTQEGETLAYANSVWVFMDAKKGRPVRPQQEDIGAYEVKEPLEMEYESRKIMLPKELEERESFLVRRFQIDTNEHVNNSQYILMALEVMPECDRAREIRVEYKKSAVLGDRIYPKIFSAKDRNVVELCDGCGNAFAIVEFKER